MSADKFTDAVYTSWTTRRVHDEVIERVHGADQVEEEEVSR